ncbi:MAG: hypothetical protein DYG98_13400 [Haliscomenobacteraceae bacterium CHB4]|nr:hypothetical protein [Saprospiraceae bacterium]MCE7924048.1 hypothetical protein [Haliscomenobacteraceae bacterium CHB4]
MKNLFSFLVLTALAVAGCKSFDKELADTMRADLNKLEAMAPAFETLNTTLGNISNQLNAAPEAMKTEGNVAYQNLTRMSGAMAQKFQATIAEYNDLTGKFRTLVADYSAGKIKTEEATKEYGALLLAMEGYTTVLDQMNQRADAMQAEMAKLSASWNAKAEEAAE